MQYKQQGLIHEYLHFLVDNVRLVERVGESHVGYMYRLVENDPRLLTFEQFYHTLYCKQARDSGDADVPEEAEEFSSDEAESSDGSKSDKAGDESDTTVKVGSEPAPKATRKRKATELVRAAKGCKDGAKRTKVATGKPTVEVEVKAKPAVKAAVAKSPAKDKAPPKSPAKSPLKKK